VHRSGFVAFDEEWRVAVGVKERLQLVVRQAAEDGRAGDLVAVEVQDRQHGAVVHGVEELVRVPARGQRAARRLAPRHLGQRRHEIGVRQAVEAVAPHALRLVATRNREQPGDARQVLMEGGVEAEHLRHTGERAAERFDQIDLRRQMLRIERLQAPQLAEHLRGGRARRGVARAAVHHAMADGPQRPLRDARLEAGNDRRDAAPMIGRLETLHRRGAGGIGDA
jgi:hypothetical protein